MRDTSKPGWLTAEMGDRYKRLALYYEARFGEPLVADADWCQSFIDAAYVAVEMQEEHDLDGEAIARAACSIAVLTHGESILEPEHL